MNKSKGFTIIELIVVIAIIAVLAAIVLVNVTQYINKAKTSSIQANLSTLETNMAVYLADTANSATPYGASACTSAKGPIVTANRNIFSSAATSCIGSTTTSDWCAGAVTPTAVDSTSTHLKWCVDSTGYHAWGTCAANACTAT